jgi:Fe-S cluster assembly protein SufD
MQGKQVSAGQLIAPADNAEIIEIRIAAGSSVAEKNVRLTGASTHVLIVVENDARAEITIILEGDIAEMNHAAEVIVGDGAQCTVLCMNAASARTALIIRQQSQVGAGGSVKWQNVTLGGMSVDHDLLSRASGHDAQSAIEWMFYARGSEKQALTVRNQFDGNNGGGEILMRGIAQDKGHTVCKGLIGIGLKGTGTNTYLTQEVLMLDKSSKVDAIPALEIKTNDVKASHSATVARVTEEDLFYFGARGIAPHEARRMFVIGFLGDITQRISNANMRNVVIDALDAKYES